MNILFDFSGNKSGGGEQLAYNYICELEKIEVSQDRYFILLPATGVLWAKRHCGNFEKVWISPSSYLRRWLFENTSLQWKLRRNGIDIIVTPVGLGLPHSKKIRSIVVFANAMSCYADSPFWSYLGFSLRLKERLWNLLKLRRLKKATQIIVETTVMQKRVSAALGIPADSLKIITPATPTGVHQRLNAPVLGRNAFGFITASYRHKNLWRLCSLAHALLKRGCANFSFIVTLTKEECLATFNKWEVDEDVLSSFEFIGAVSPELIQEVYERIDYLMLMSDIESFSHNYLEAWATGTPLIASDRDFARNICADSAFYIEPHNVEDTADKLVRFMEDEELKQRLVEKGRTRLKTIPDARSRAEQLIREITGNRES